MKLKMFFDVVMISEMMTERKEERRRNERNLQAIPQTEDESGSIIQHLKL